MAIILFFLLIIFNTTNCWYQDSVINGQIVEKGERNGQPSYQVIKKVLDLYQRPFTVLDIGAAQGFFSFMTAYEYNATCVMVEGNYDYLNHTDKLLDLCKKNTTLNQIIFLEKLIDLDFLQKLSDCEHFDITLALNFVHHSGLDWQKTIDLLVEMGDNLILENPPADELNLNQLEINKRTAIDKYMQNMGAVLIGEVERFNKSISYSKIWWLHKPKIFLKKRHTYWPPPSYVSYVDDGKYHLIDSDFTKKELVKKIENNELRSNWINGINLVSFLSFGGKYPEIEVIINEIDKLKLEQVYDWGIANMIISGKKINLIDRVDFSCQYAYKNLINLLKSKKTLNAEIYWCLNQSCPNINDLIHRIYLSNNNYI